MAAPRYGSPLKRAVTFYIPLVLMVGMTLFPFYWMVITSIRPDSELYNVRMNPFFTLHPTFKHFQDLFELTMFARWAWNTLFIAIVSTASPSSAACSPGTPWRASSSAGPHPSGR